MQDDTDHQAAPGDKATLADIVGIIMIAGPVVWSLNELRKAGRDCFAGENLGWTLRHLVGILPAGLVF